METSITEFMSIGIVGTFLSIVIQYVQNKWGVEGAQTKAIAVAFSVILGGIVWFLQGTALWASIIGVLAAASTVYALIFSGVRK
jgi:hypothetical protein